MSKVYMKTISCLVTESSTVLPEGLKILKIVNTDATNFVELSIDAAIGTALNDEAILLATDNLDYSNSGTKAMVPGNTLFHKADTATVNISIFGYIN